VFIIEYSYNLKRQLDISESYYQKEHQSSFKSHL